MLSNTFHPCSLISYRSSLLTSSVSILLIKVNELFSVVSMNWILFISLEHYKKQLKSLVLKSYQLIFQILRKGFEKFLKFGLDDELTIRLFLVTLKIIFMVLCLIMSVTERDKTWQWILSWFAWRLVFLGKNQWTWLRSRPWQTVTKRDKTWQTEPCHTKRDKIIVATSVCFSQNYKNWKRNREAQIKPTSDLWFVHWCIHGFLDSLIDCLIDCLIDGFDFIDLLWFDLLWFDWVVQFIDSLIRFDLFGWLIGWLIACVCCAFVCVYVRFSPPGARPAPLSGQGARPLLARRARRGPPPPVCQWVGTHVCRSACMQGNCDWVMIWDVCGVRM